MYSMTEFRLDPSALRGRGTGSRLAHRFETQGRVVVDDGWGTLDETAAETASPVRTEIIFETARTALTTNDSPDIYFDQSVNPYRGCEHGCIYCYARPTHSYLNLSPGLDFETKIIAKSNITDLLRTELQRPRYTPSMICVGSATDCYQPVERKLKLTRSLIELFAELGHPFSLVTKSSGVERDIDLIAPMAAKKQAAIYVTLTTLDGDVASKLEPRAAAPHRRLRTIKALADAGIPVGVSLAPQIPFITEDLEKVLEAAWEAGARAAFYHVLRLPWEVAPLFKEWLEVHYPDRADRVMARVREMRGGKDYDSNYATRMKGSGVWASLIGKRFETATRRMGFNRGRFEFDFSEFKGAGAVQRGLF